MEEVMETPAPDNDYWLPVGGCLGTPAALVAYMYSPDDQRAVRWARYQQAARREGYRPATLPDDPEEVVWWIGPDCEGRPRAAPETTPNDRPVFVEIAITGMTEAQALALVRETVDWGGWGDRIRVVRAHLDDAGWAFTVKSVREATKCSLQEAKDALAAEENDAARAIRRLQTQHIGGVK